MFADLTDTQLTALHSLLDDEIDRNRHEPSRVSEEDDKAISEMMAGVNAQAYERRKAGKGEQFWWAHA